jgi:hypothetical protein
VFLKSYKSHQALSADNFQLISLTTLKILDIFNSCILQVTLFLKGHFSKMTFLAEILTGPARKNFGKNHF